MLSLSLSLHLEASDQTSVTLLPAHRTLVKVTKPTTSVVWKIFWGTSGLLFHHRVQTSSFLKQHHWPPGIHQDHNGLHKEVHGQCHSHQKHLHLGQPEAMADRGRLQAPTNLERCLQSWRQGGQPGPICWEASDRPRDGTTRGLPTALATTDTSGTCGEGSRP